MEFTFSGTIPERGAPFDDRGLLYWLGTSRGTRPYRNPHRLRAVRCTWSSEGFGDYSGFVSHSHNYAWTGNQENSWAQVDLGEELHFCPNYYSLRCCTLRLLRTWQLQGSNDAVEWTTLREHVNDDVFNSTTGSDIASWPVEATDFYRLFRILQVGPNGSGGDQLACGGIELYGKVCDTVVIVILQLSSSWHGVDIVSASEETVICTNVAGDVVAELENETLNRSIKDARRVVADRLGLASHMIRLLLPGGLVVRGRTKKQTLLRVLLEASAVSPPHDETSNSRQCETPRFQELDTEVRRDRRSRRSRK